MPDSDFDAVKASRKPGAPLRIDGLLTELPADKADDLLRVLRLPAEYNRNLIATVVNGWGHTLSPEAVSKWRLRNNIHG